MKTKRSIVGVSMVAAGLLVVSLVSASAFGPPEFGPRLIMRHGGPGFFFPGIFRALDLTDEQRGQLRDIRAAHRETFQTLRNQMVAVRDEIAAKLFSPEQVTEEELKPQVERLAKLRSQLLNEGLRIALEVRGVLTEEQRVKAAELKQRLEALRAEMRGLLAGNE